MRQLPDTKALALELVRTNTKKEKDKRTELIALIEDYFGKEDAQLIVALIVYFKRPGRFGWLYKEVKKRLEEVEP